MCGSADKGLAYGEQWDDEVVEEPTEDEVEEQAKALLERIGLNSDDFEFDRVA